VEGKGSYWYFKPCSVLVGVVSSQA